MSKGETVEVDDLGIVDIFFDDGGCGGGGGGGGGSAWPSGKFLKSIIETELSRVRDTSGAATTPDTTNGEDDDNGSILRRHQCATASDHYEGNYEGKSEIYWQAKARYALLNKYNLFVIEAGHSDGANTTSKSLPSSYSTCHQNDDEDYFSQEIIDQIQSRWNELVVEAEQTASHSRTLSSSSSSSKASSHHHYDLLEFLSEGKSNGRNLRWALMKCPPGCQFRLHAHPNIELVYCLQGELHEVRMEGPPVDRSSMMLVDPEQQRQQDQEEEERTSSALTTTTTSSNATATNPTPAKILGPNITNLKRPWYFHTLHAGQWLVNECGSIHKSFTSTCGIGCTLLVMWGGSHANISNDHAPQSPSIDEAVNIMDSKLTTTTTITTTTKSSSSSSPSCRYCTSNMGQLSETFLPESERRTTKVN